MKNTIINYVTNVIGLAIIGLAFYEYFATKDWRWFLGLIFIGFVLLVLKNETLKSIINRIIDVIIKAKTPK